MLQFLYKMNNSAFFGKMEGKGGFRTFESVGYESTVYRKGPEVTSFAGGLTGTYVKTLGRSGKGTLVIRSAGTEEVEIPFEIRIKTKEREA